MEVIRNQEFLLLPVDEVAKLLASDDLNVPSEENIFHVSIVLCKKFVYHETSSKKCNFTNKLYKFTNLRN